MIAIGSTEFYILLIIVFLASIALVAYAGDSCTC